MKDNYFDIKKISRIISARKIALRKSLDTKISELTRENELLREEIKNLRDSASIDILTKTYTRNFYESQIEAICEEYHSKNQKIGFVLLDLDNLKQANDTYGHSHGDTILRNFSHLVSQCIKSKDYLFRIGGDEFLVLLCGPGTKGCDLVKSRIQEKVQLHNKHAPETQQIFFSAGYSVLSPSSIKKDEYRKIIDNYFHIADQNMYLEKKQKQQ